MKHHNHNSTLKPILLAAFLGGCAAGMVQTSQSISANLSSKEYNDIATRYLDRPTFVSIDVMKDGSRVLCVSMNAYGPNDHIVRFFEKNREQYISAVDKFLAWEEKAVKNRDIFEKEIAIIPSPNGVKMGFVFISGNETTHFLSVCWTMGSLLGQVSAPALTFDRENALRLRTLLVDLPNLDARSRADEYH